MLSLRRCFSPALASSLASAEVFALGLLLVSTLFGCGVKIIPSSGSAGTIDPARNLIVQERGGFTVSVQSMAWAGSPYYLEQYYTPFFVTVHNSHQTPLPLSHDAFTLVDDGGNQFHVVSPEKVWEILYEKRRPVVYLPPYSPYYYDRYMRYERYPRFPYPYYYPYYYPSGIYEISPSDEYARSQSTDIILEGLVEGEIAPDARVSGFVYFRKATGMGNRLNLRVVLEGVEFTFPFDLVRRSASGRSSGY